jgi:hypothetical protein
VLSLDFIRDRGRQQRSAKSGPKGAEGRILVREHPGSLCPRQNVLPLETHRREKAGDTRSQEAPRIAGGPLSLGQGPKSWHMAGLQGSSGVPPDLYPIRKVLKCSE